MAERTVVTYTITCDSCGLTANEHRPVDWVVVEETHRGMRSHDSVPISGFPGWRKAWDLCPSCRNAFEVWMQRPQPAAPSGGRKPDELEHR